LTLFTDDEFGRLAVQILPYVSQPGDGKFKTNPLYEFNSFYHMKKIIISAISVLFLFAFANGQITKGTWMIGGSGALYSRTSTHKTNIYDTKSKYTDIDLAVSAGYFVADKTALGLRSSVYFSKEKDFEDARYNLNEKQFVIGPFGRYYFLNTDRLFNIVSDLSYQFGRFNMNGHKSNVSNFSVMAGPVIFFNTSIGLEVLLGYSSQKKERKGVYMDTHKGFQTTIGFQIYLEKK
jgi:hypothetical protein